MSRALLSLGSNLGDRAALLRGAVAGLAAEVSVVAVSGVYESTAWGDPGPEGEESPPYLNAALLAEDAGDDPAEWLRRSRRLEEAAGRLRRESWRYAPRTLDVDVISVWGSNGAPVLSDSPELTLPHPRAHQRAFVLRPWLDIQPYAQLPPHGWVHELLRTDPIAGALCELRTREDLTLEGPPNDDGP